MSRYRLKNFTPVPDEIVEKYGGMAGLVYGRIWRYTNGGLRDCTASVSRIARDLGLSRPTIQKHIKALINGKEIIDKTPDRRNAPHILNITKQLSLTLSMGFDEIGVKKIDTKGKKGVKNFDSGCKESLHKDTSKDTNKRKDKKRKPRKPDLLFDAISEVCCIDPRANGSSIAKVRHTLGKAGYTPEDVHTFGDWWNSDEWRKEKGPPTIWTLQQRIAIVKQEPEDRSKKILEESNAEAKLKMMEQDEDE